MSFAVEELDFVGGTGITSFLSEFIVHSGYDSDYTLFEEFDLDSEG